MEKLLIGILISIAVSLSTLAQTTLKGSIIDTETGEKVLFASISVQNSNASTLTNEQGEFTLSVNTLPANLVISHLNYGKYTVKVTENTELTIKLKPVIVALPEVTVGNYGSVLVANAARELFKNYNQKYYGKAFYRQNTQIDNEATEWQEIMYDVKSSNSRVEGSIVENGRYAAQKSIIKFENFSFYTKAFGVFDGDTNAVTVIHPKGNELFNYTVKNILKQGNKEIAEVAFSCKPDKCKTYKQGTIFIDTDTYDILKFNITLNSNMGLSLNNKHPLWNMKTENHLFEFEMSFKDLNNDRVLDYIKADFTFDYLLRSETHKVAVSSLTYFYNTTDKESGLVYESAKPKIEDREVIKKFKYNPEFWKNNPIVERTPMQDKIIKDLEKEGSFGNAFAANKPL